MKVNSNIDTVSYISPEDFKKLYFKTQKPLVIKGFANQTPAGKKWSIQYMQSSCGDVTVDIYNSDNKKNKASAFTKADMKMRFSDYVNILIKNEPSGLRMFLFNMFRHKPNLRKDFPCPGMFKGILGRIGYMFFGSKETKVRIHQDIDMSSVLLTQFYGRKKVLLIDPKFSELVYRLPFNTYSLINPDEPDFSKYPGLEHVEAQECILESGDALFIPSGFWHYITYLDGGFAVSYRKLAPKISTQVKGAVYLMIYMPFDKIMNRILGDKWLEKKEAIADKRANKAIANYLLNSEKAFEYKDHSDMAA